MVNEVDIGADEAMRPGWIDKKVTPKQINESLIVGATYEDKHAGGMSLKIVHEVGWERPASRGALGAGGVTQSGSCEPSAGWQLQVLQRGMLEALPDLRLPATVETFDGILKARLARRSKDGRDPEAQASADDLTDGVGVLTRTLENQCVVELCVVGKTILTPSSDEQFDHDGGGNGLARIAGGNTSVNRDAGEYSELGSASDTQAFNGVEGVELATFRGELRQIPTDRRRRSADPVPAIQNASTLEDAADGASRGDRSDLLDDHRRTDGIRAGVSEIALGELAAHPQNIIFGGDARSIDGLSRTRLPVAPIDPIKPRGGGAFDPALHRPKVHVILARNTAQRAAASNRLHHRTTLLLDGVLYSRALSLFLAAYQPPKLPPTAIPPARGTGLWNLPGYGKPAKKPAAFPQPLENAPRPPPAFPTATTAPTSDPEKSLNIKPNQAKPCGQVTLGCWHLSDAELLALRR